MKGLAKRAFFIKLSCYILWILTLTVITNALDLPLEDLMKLSQFHCFEVQICRSPLEYCNSHEQECRPCTAEVCARRGGDDFPLQCNLNCTVADALESDTAVHWKNLSFVQSRPYLWFCLLISLVPASILMSVCWFKRSKIKDAYTMVKKKKALANADEESGLLQNETSTQANKETQTVCLQTETRESQYPQTEDNKGSPSYCNEKLRGTCESNQDKTKNIATNVSQTHSVNQNVSQTATGSISMLAVVNEDHETDLTQSKLAGIQQPSSFTETFDSGSTSLPLHAAPSLDIGTFNDDPKL